MFAQAFSVTNTLLFARVSECCTVISYFQCIWFSVEVTVPFNFCDENACVRCGALCLVPLTRVYVVWDFCLRWTNVIT